MPLGSSVLVLNVGSSSLKFAISEGKGDRWNAAGAVTGIGAQPQLQIRLPAPSRRDLPEQVDHGDAAGILLAWLAEMGLHAEGISGIGHRIVHGGAQFSEPILVDDAVEAELSSLARLAPLHMPPCLAVLARFRRALPRMPNIACFDTAFHATQPDVATRLPLPQRFHDRGFRRYGFHGLNYEHVVRELPGLTSKPLPRRMIIAHLGHGASLCAVLDGKSVATTMGYSAADGLVMSTRTGSIDPGALIAIQREDGLSADAIEDLVYRRSGLLGLSGLSGDMQTLLQSQEAGAKRAIESYCYWAARHMASLLAALGGLDALVFTGGVGENAAAIRERIIGHLGWLGITLGNDRRATTVSTPDSRVAVHIVPADEEATIARHARRVLQSLTTVTSPAASRPS